MSHEGRGHTYPRCVQPESINKKCNGHVTWRVSLASVFHTCLMSVLHNWRLVRIHWIIEYNDVRLKKLLWLIYAKSIPYSFLFIKD